MNAQEFSDKFDTLLNSYATKAEFGDQSSLREVSLDEYEKSVFLTEAQNELVIGFYSGRNVTGSGFEETEELRRYLAPLISEETLSPLTNSSGHPLSNTSAFFTLPKDVWFITLECVNVSSGDDACMDGSVLDVVPVTQDEFHKVKRNPFRGANRRRALRLDLSEGNVQIVSKYTVTSYFVRYLRKPKPIVLVDLSADKGEGISIEGISEPQEPVCELPDSLHTKILERAVLLALQSRGAKVKD